MKDRWSKHDSEEIKWRERKEGQRAKQNEEDIQMKHIGTQKRNQNKAATVKWKSPASLRGVRMQ